MKEEDLEAMYEPEERWKQIVVSLGWEDRHLKAAMRKLANEEDRTLSRQIVLILRAHLKNQGRL